MTNYSEVPVPERLGNETSEVIGERSLPTPMDSLSSDTATSGTAVNRSPSPLDFIAESDSAQTLPAPMDFIAGSDSNISTAATQLPSPSPEHTRDYAAKDPKVAGLPTPMDFVAEAISGTVEASPTPHDEN